MTKQTHFRTFQIKRNDILSVPIDDLAKLAEAMVAYKAGDNFSILRCHDFMMQPPVRQHLGLPEFDVRGLYRAVELLGRNKEPIVTAFRQRFQREYVPGVTYTVFD